MGSFLRNAFSLGGIVVSTAYLILVAFDFGEHSTVYSLKEFVGIIGSAGFLLYVVVSNVLKDWRTCQLDPECRSSLEEGSLGEVLSHLYRARQSQDYLIELSQDCNCAECSRGQSERRLLQQRAASSYAHLSRSIDLLSARQQSD